MFLDDDYLLDNDTARYLYTNYVKDIPVFDYHCHLSPKDIFEDKCFDNYTEISLSGDHYKWRLLRGEGVSENEITGDADPYTKFYRFCCLLPKLIGNPVYVWTHLELKRYFGYDRPLSEATAADAWEKINGTVRFLKMSPRYFIGCSNVRFIGTTDDPCDDLSWHSRLAWDRSFKTTVAPSFRPDKALNVTSADYRRYIEKLGVVSGTRILSLDDLKNALSGRIRVFKGHGMLASDHGLPYFMEKPEPYQDPDRIFKKALSGEVPSREEYDAFAFEMLTFLAREYKNNDVVMQIHYGAKRDLNSKAFGLLGPDTGFDAIGNCGLKYGLADFLDTLERYDMLPRTVIYSLDPNDNAMIDSVIGAFQGHGIKGRIQHGAAWWFNDTYRGIMDHLRSLSGLSVLGNFIGMLTDSRSFLSYVRHDYFRRILCSFLSEQVNEGSYPRDLDLLGGIAADISYNNAARYFGFVD